MGGSVGLLMLRITTKLKRVRAMRFCADALLFIPRLPIILFYLLGQCAEWIDGLLETAYYKLEMKIVKAFRWNEVAREQYKKNPDKFKY